jgi:hypothetical protein
MASKTFIQLFSCSTKATAMQDDSAGLNPTHKTSTSTCVKASRYIYSLYQALKIRSLWRDDWCRSTLNNTDLCCTAKFVQSERKNKLFRHRVMSQQHPGRRQKFRPGVGSLSNPPSSVLPVEVTIDNKEYLICET